MARSTTGRRRTAALLAATVAAVGLPLLTTPVALADSAPVAPVAVRTVTADSLPTVQINGVVWDQVIVGNTVYVTGSFSSARPAGAAAGTNETARGNLLAYDLTTGNLVTTWAPTLNAQGLTIDASADGSRIFVGGEFTSVSGTARNRLAALDARTGALITAFNPNPNASVRSIDVDGDTVYAGGKFTTMRGQARSRLAAVATSDGTLRAWAPTVDAEVFAVTAPSGSGTVVAGGRFRFANSQDVRGLGAFSAADASLRAWPSYGIFPNYGPNSAIYSLTSDGTQVFGTGYDFGGPSPFENSFGIELATGAVNWVNGCKGDTYSSVPIGDVLYTVGHPHDCGMVQGHPQSDPWTFQRATAQTKYAATDGRVNTYGSYQGYRAPELLHWLPTYNAGTYTGQGQAGWDVTGTSEYIVVGGEFPRVNGTAQQGLSRFRINGPNQQGPQGGGDLTPTLVSLGAGTVRVSWTSAWDRDNRQLTYEVLRGATLGTSTVVKTITADSAWWNRPVLAFTDSTAPAGSSQTYRIRVKDAFGNTVVGATGTATVPGGAAEASAYRDAVLADAPGGFWRLGEADGTAAYDWAGGSDLTLDASAQRGTAGAVPGSDAATTFPGTAAVPATTTGTARPGPQTFSVEAWIKTAGTSGGKIVGFGNSSTGDSGGYDRHVYMTNDGRLVFGVYPGFPSTVTSSTTYNDDRWHHVVATLGPAGQTLYVDGRRVARRTDTTAAQDYAGFWRIGGDNLGGWPDGPSNSRFTGAIDEVAVYPGVLSPERVAAHFTAGGGQVRTGTRPTDAYGSTVFDAQPDGYWRLNETTGTTVADVTANGADGRLFGGTVLGAPGVAATTGVTLDGVDDQVSGAAPVSNPTVYSEELWFNTTTTRGGKLIGFGDQQSGLSGSYDRHVYMFDDGRLRFGVWTGQTNVIDSPAAYNDGRWHHLVATQGGDGMKLYVDGQLVGSNPQTGAQDYTGYWKVGGDTTWGGNSSNFFAGAIDEVAVYSSVLTAAQVSDHFAKGGGQTTPANTAPTAAFTSTADGLKAAFDATTSVDPDGTIASWSWDFGDGTPAGTGVTTEHTYAAPGTYTITLTVTDNAGGTDTETQPVTIQAPPPVNVAPTAAFTASATGLSVALDGTTSADPDGSIASYAWDFGDGTPAGSGATVTHPYAAAGTYTVKLTVTDDKGATGTSENTVTVTAPPPANTAPTASFTSSATGLAATFDGSGSTDPDGTITGYAWNFGDGATGTGATASHTYAAAGTFDVTLTVTDDGQATAQSVQQVTVVAAPTAYATDTFSRTVAAGFGSADTGGAWTRSGGAAADYSVSDGTGTMVLTAAAAQRAEYLNSVAQTDTEVNTTVTLDKAPTGGGTYVSVVGRRVGTAGDYRAKVWFVAGGAVQVRLSRTVGTTETSLGSTTLPGLTYTPGQVLRIRLQVSGTGTTTLAAKAWPDGTPEPATFAVTATDTTAALQAPGAVGLVAYLSGSSTNPPVTARFDDFTAGPRRTG